MQTIEVLQFLQMIYRKCVCLVWESAPVPMGIFVSLLEPPSPLLPTRQLPGPITLSGPDNMCLPNTVRNGSDCPVPYPYILSIIYIYIYRERDMVVYYTFCRECVLTCFLEFRVLCYRLFAYKHCYQELLHEFIFGSPEVEGKPMALPRNWQLPITAVFAVS